MTTLFHNFSADGCYTGSAPAPINPLTGNVADINDAVATLEAPPDHDPETQLCRRVGGVWTVDAIPEPELPPVTGPLTPQYPVFFANAKLDLFTPSEQLAVVTAAMTDPVVKLMYDRLLGAAFLTYEDPETEQGLQLLVAKELLTPERKAQIVAQMQPQ
jgi:hypothetical protein